MNDKTVPAAARSNLPDAADRIADLLGGMANIQASISEAGGVASTLPFIGINNGGKWSYGQDRTEVEKGSQWAVDIRSWQHGYIAWPGPQAKERKPLGERMVPASRPLPVKADLPDVGVDYTMQFSFELLCISGEDKGRLALYKNGSYGTKVIVQDLVEKVRMQARLDPARVCPVVVLDIRTYFHPDWKKDIHNPVLQIQKWISFEEYDAFDRIGASAADPAIEEATDDEAPWEEDVKPAPKAEPEVVQAAARGQGRRPEPPTPQPVPNRRRQPGRAA